MSLEYTGERYIPGRGNVRVRYEHLHRYIVARRYVNKKRVLDIGCGEGYGASFLAQAARWVVGLDINTESVRHATCTYPLKNLAFLRAKATSLPICNESVDVVTCFELIEHLEEHEELLREIARCLHPEGILILSSPNREVFQRESGVNPFHVKELNAEELLELLSRHFASVQLFGQRVVMGSLVWQYPQGPEWLIRGAGEVAVVDKMLPPLEDRKEFLCTPLYCLVICRKSPKKARNLGGLSIYVDEREDLLREEIEQHMHGMSQIIQHKDRVVATKEETIQAMDKLSREKDATLAQWDHELKSLKEILANREELIQEKDGSLAFLSQEIQRLDERVKEQDTAIRARGEELGSLKATLELMRTQLAEKEVALGSYEQLVREKESHLCDLQHEKERLRAFYMRVSRFWPYKVYRFFRKPWNLNPLEGLVALKSELARTFTRWIGRGEPSSEKARQAWRLAKWHMVPSSREPLHDEPSAPADVNTGLTSQEISSNTHSTVIEPEAVRRPEGLDLDSTGAAPGARKILLKRRNAAGDVLLTTPIIREIKARHPDSAVDVWTLCPELLKNNPQVDRLLTHLPDEDQYDQVLDLAYEPTPNLNIVEAYARIAGVEATSPTPELYLSHEERAYAHERLAELRARPDRPLVVIHPIAGWPIKHWPVSRFRALVEKLEADYGATCLILGHPEAPEYEFGQNLTGKTTIRQAAALIEQSHLAITVDSSLMHAAYSLGVPVIALFGCTDPDKILPADADVTALQSDILCRGCHHRQSPPADFFSPPTCLFETVLCMEDILVDEVMGHCREQLKNFPNKLCSIVVPSFNPTSNTRQCLDAVFANTREFPLEVLVVDDASTDAAGSLMEPYGERIKIIRNETNQGFTKSVNIGAQAARGEYLVILNNDTLPERGWLKELVQALEYNPEVGIAGPKLLYPDDRTIQHAGLVINEDGVAEHIYRHMPEDYPAANRFRKFRALTGACLVMKRDYFVRLGGFDEAFYNGAEDTDLCFRVLEDGKAVQFCPTSVVLHYEGSSRGLNPSTDSQNRRLLAKKWPHYLKPDIHEYFWLEEVEAHEGRTFLAPEEVPEDVRLVHQMDETPQIRYPYKVELGCGHDPNPGYIHLDIEDSLPHIEYVHDLADPLPFRDNIVGEVLANHVIEHLSYRKILSLFQEVFRVLTPGGVFKLRTPDLQFIGQKYLEGQKTPEFPPDESYIEENFGEVSPSWWAILKLFSAQDRPGNIHYACYDFPTLKRMLDQVGFERVVRKEFGREYSPGEIQCLAYRPYV
jgi:GT2 family glycosyltransferase/ADP-heptose:LPS heptosyltransferase/predicted SAM-dependent methyltransferase